MNRKIVVEGVGGKEKERESHGGEEEEEKEKENLQELNLKSKIWNQAQANAAKVMKHLHGLAHRSKPR